MLTEKKEIEIISRAKQKNVRDPNRSRKHFENIFNDFFLNIDFNGKLYLDLGPGQYDFGVLAKTKGAKEIYAIDNDEAVIELGNYKKFNVKFADLKNLNFNLFNIKFDGIFCKFSINALWYKDISFYDNFEKMLNNKGWVWLAPWNGIGKKSDLKSEEIYQRLNFQIDQFKSRNFDIFLLDSEYQIKYGVHGIVENNILITKNLTCNILKYFKKI